MKSLTLVRTLSCPAKLPLCYMRKKKLHNPPAWGRRTGRFNKSFLDWTWMSPQSKRDLKFTWSPCVISQGESTLLVRGRMLIRPVWSRTGAGRLVNSSLKKTALCLVCVQHFFQLGGCTTPLFPHSGCFCRCWLPTEDLSTVALSFVFVLSLPCDHGCVTQACNHFVGGFCCEVSSILKIFFSAV